MITKVKSVCIVFILSILFVSISNARTVKAVSVSGGEEHSMVLDEHNRVWTCGDNSYGQIGHNEDYDVLNLVLKGEQASDSNFLENISGIGAGWTHSLAVDLSGSVWAWGSDSSGCLGNGTESGSDYPVQVHAGEQNPSYPDSNLCNIIQVASGRSGTHSLAIDSTGGSGICLAWGNNDYGQCSGTENPYVRPKKVFGGDMGTQFLQSIISVSAGAYHSMALAGDGYVYCFGWDLNGMLGINGNGGYYTTPKKVKGVGGSGYLSDINSISAGWWHSMALQKYVSGSGTYKGRVYCWGGNGSGWSGYGCSGGRLGDSTTTDRAAPVLVLKGQQNSASNYLEEIIAIGAGESHCIALDIYGNVWAWGDNGYGQLGTNSYTDSLTPVKVLGQNGVGYLSNIIAISAGYWHNLAVDSDGVIWVWGNNYNGKLGLGDTNNRLTPVPLPMLDEPNYLTPPIDVELTKTDNVGESNCVYPSNEIIDNFINYTICYTAGEDVNDANIIDILPEDVYFQSCTGGGDYNEPLHQVVWDLGNLDANDANCFTLTVKVADFAVQGSTITNTAKMYSANTLLRTTNEPTKICCVDNVVYVDCNATGLNNGSNWDNAYTELRDALADIRTGLLPCASNIWVADGNYAPAESDDPSPANKTFQMINGINVYGHFAGIDAQETMLCQRNLADANNETILTGDINGNNTADVNIVVTDANMLLDGFTVKKGLTAGIYANNHKSTILNCTVKNNNIGMNFVNHANAVITNCLINNNSSYGISTNNTAGLDINSCTVNLNTGHNLYAVSGVVRTFDSVFSNSTAGGGIYATSNCNLTAENCTIASNHVDGVYSYSNTTHLNIEKCLIQNNVRDGMLINNSDGSSKVSSSIVKGNNRNGITITSGTFSVVDNMIYRNSLFGVDSISNPIVRNNTIVYNLSCGVAQGQDVNVNITNNIIYGNTVKGISFVGSNYYYNVIINYNCIQSGYNGDGTGNLVGQNPQFRNAVNDDFHLNNTSPCINTGNPSTSGDNETDIDGEQRKIGSAVDMGSDEHCPYDLSLDGCVNFEDFAIFAKAWGTHTGQTDFNDRCDFYDDGATDYINYRDLEIFCDYWLSPVDWQGIGGDGAYFAEAECPLEGGEMMMMSIPPQSSESLLVSPANTLAGLEDSAISSESVETIQEPFDVNETLDWLNELWQTDESIRESTSEADWQEFLDAIKSSQ